jgi:hypothetical protein
MRLQLRILAMMPVFATGISHAADFSVEGYADVRVIAPPKTDAYLDGGLGKLRTGDDDSHFKFGDAVGVLHARQDDWSFEADGRLNTEYGPAVDLLQGFVRYAPASNSNWSWSARAGAFFPPLSLENDQVGWSTFWTVTPSAIDSWVGAELRTIGAEASLDWKSNGNDVSLNGALFGWNDSAGVLIAERGWNFDDRVAGLFEKTRLPDVVTAHPPATIPLFREIDATPGWYLDLSYEIDGKTGFEVMRYDNEADPTRPRAWHTAFWDLGLRQQIGAVTLLSQAVSGSTLIRPSPAAFVATDFKAAYALVGWDLDAWWLAARADVFQTRTQTTSALPLSEDGHAFDATASWRLRNWLRLSAEWLYVDDTRAERALAGDAPHQIERQFQFVVRTYF